MTNSFLKQKDLESKYGSSKIPHEEHRNKQVEDICTQKMTGLMKKMLSTKNYCSPLRKGFKKVDSQLVSKSSFSSPK